jgi:TRAP-type C4-dicarboxylate transport system substrate-binding protein
MNKQAFARSIKALAVASLFIGGAANAQEHTLRLSTLMKPDSDGARAAESFAQKVAEKTDGRIAITVYPASQLGDWIEVHEQVSFGALDLAMQPLSNSYDQRLAIAWFPYTTTTYDSAEQAFSEGGYIHQIVDEVIAEQNLKLLGVYGVGMGGAGFATEVDNAADPNADHGLKVRVWPGGTTHRYLMERLGFNTATVPWAELYTGLQTGVVDGQIGGTPEMALDNFKDVTKTWIQYNDHFEPAWFFINLGLYESLPEADQKALAEAAQEITKERFAEVRKMDQAFLQQMRDAGIEVVELDEPALEEFARVTRAEVWPDIEGEVGEDVMARLRSALKLN